MKNLKKRISIYILKKGAVIMLSLAKTNQENRYLIHILNSKRFQQLKNQKWKMRFDWYFIDTKEIRKYFRSRKHLCCCYFFLGLTLFQWFWVRTLSVLCTGTAFQSMPIFLYIYAMNLWEVLNFSFSYGTQAFVTRVCL